jgi:hypothetical protein
MSEPMQEAFQACLDDVRYFKKRFEKRVSEPRGQRFQAPLVRLEDLEERLEQLRDTQTAPGRARTALLPSPSVGLLATQIDARLDTLVSDIDQHLKNPASSEAGMRKLSSELNLKFAKMTLTLSSILDSLTDRGRGFAQLHTDLTHLREENSKGPDGLEERLTKIEHDNAENHAALARLEQATEGLASNLEHMTLDLAETQGSLKRLRGLEEKSERTLHELSTVRAELDERRREEESSRQLQSRGIREAKESGAAAYDLLQRALGSLGQLAQQASFPSQSFGYGATALDGGLPSATIRLGPGDMSSGALEGLDDSRINDDDFGTSRVDPAGTREDVRSPSPPAPEPLSEDSDSTGSESSRSGNTAFLRDLGAIDPAKAPLPSPFEQPEEP